MALLDLWRSSRAQIEDKQVHQLLAFAGTGLLGEDTDTSRELRSLLAEVPSALLKRYIDECLSTRFDQSGFVLQDLVNEIGQRLGFQVEHGRYRGVAGHTGNDGLWRSSARHILVEVKTTDAYRVSLNTVAGYRQQLIAAERILAEGSSVLLVVGRQDTGDLEAQIRGSRHAWSIRVISADALLRLLSIKESVDDPTTFEKIVGILTPQEYTRVDGIVDLVFQAAEDIQDELGEGNGKAATSPAAFNDESMRRAEERVGRTLTKTSRTLYRSSDGKVAALCLVSKLHASLSRYWFAFHPRQQEQLEAASDAFVVLGCGSPEVVLAIPWAEFKPWLSGMFKTETDARMYWHVSIDSESFHLLRRKGEPKICLKQYIL